MPIYLGTEYIGKPNFALVLSMDGFTKQPFHAKDPVCLGKDIRAFLFGVNNNDCKWRGPSCHSTYEHAAGHRHGLHSLCIHGHGSCPLSIWQGRYNLYTGGGGRRQRKYCRRYSECANFQPGRQGRLRLPCDAGACHPRLFHFDTRGHEAFSRSRVQASYSGNTRFVPSLLVFSYPFSSLYLRNRIGVNARGDSVIKKAGGRSRPCKSTPPKKAESRSSFSMGVAYWV
jgi:hypothetical protein